LGFIVLANANRRLFLHIALPITALVISGFATLTI